MSDVSTGHTLPLFERFPSLQSALPRIELVSAPTAVEHHEALGREIGYDSLWIKRDDLSNSIYGGNKPRKLEFVFARLIEDGCDSVVTMGGIGTNHGLATAIFARELGLGCHLVLFDQPLTLHCRKTLRLYHRYGASMHFAPNYPAVAVTTARIIASARIAASGHRKVGLVPAGGTSVPGTLGFVNAGLELGKQVEQGLIEAPKFIFCAAGSCGTLAGLTLGIRLAGLSTQVIGVRVVDRIVVNRPHIAWIINRTLALLRQHDYALRVPDFSFSDIHLIDGYLGRSYGDVTPKGKRAVEIAKKHNIVLDTTYTGKTFAALTDFVSEISPKAGPVMFWQTFNSRDLTSEAEQVDWRELPEVFRQFFAVERKLVG